RERSTLVKGIRRPTEGVRFHPTKGNLVIGKNRDGDQVYAKDADENEFYPAPYIHAFSKAGVPLYAKTKNGNLIFPKTPDGDEYYMHNDNDSSDIIEQNGILVPRYAKTASNDEMYPFASHPLNQPLYKEIIIGKRYATSSNNRPLHPLDYYGNEYTMVSYKNSHVDEELCFPNSYPITNDGWVIVPDIKNRPYISRTMLPGVENENIIGKLFRDELGFRDSYKRSLPKKTRLLAIIK
ncbi:hypothetical protein AVEN_241251-1, partial [Araneus ventricosus]